MAGRDEKTKQFTMADLTGQRFGMLTALEPLEERHQGCVIWHHRRGRREYVPGKI